MDFENPGKSSPRNGFAGVYFGGYTGVTKTTAKIILLKNFRWLAVMLQNCRVLDIYINVLLLLYILNTSSTYDCDADCVRK